MFANNATSTKSARVPKPPTPYLLLNRAISHADSKSEAFMVELIELWANPRGFTAAQEALSMAADSLGLRLSVDDIDDMSDDDKAAINTIRLIRYKRGWLYDFIAIICEAFNEDEELTPDEVMRRLAAEMDDFYNRIDAAREVLKEVPGHLAAEIRAAARNLEAANEK